MKLKVWTTVTASVALMAMGASAIAAPLPEVIASEALPPGFIYGDYGIGADGRYLMRVTRDGTVDLWDRSDGSTAPLPPAGAGGMGGFTDVGSKVLISSTEPLDPADTNGVSDVYMRDLSTGIDRRISLSRRGGQLKRASFVPDTKNLPNSA